MSDMNAAYAKLKKHGVREASRDGPQRLPDWNNNAAGIRAFYFRAPDGHYLEILQFPPDKGDPKWHRADDRLFLGIDHTAIVVANTESSLRFYRDRLGFCLVGGSENYGPEQEKLNNVLGAHLRITTLRGTSGPAIEFLEYLNPRDGRDIRSDQQCNDIAYWKTTIEVDNPVAIEGTDSIRFPAQRNSMPNGNWNTDDLSRPIDLSDPTGHAIRLQKAHAQGAPG
ncbi:MAG: VOC family protein [Planctomycetes bacterium]|nr:VOC family protein [Planctomycetota bacterium]